METCPVCGVAFEAPADKGLLTRCPACKCDYLSSGAGAAPLRRPGSLSDRPGDRVTLPATFTERFRLGKLLGSGESSIVFLADDLSSDRRVAVKFLARASGPDQMARFLDERRRVGQVEHPNVAATIDVLELDGCPCLVTEYVEGGSLRQRLSVRKRLGAREAVRVATEVLAGLAACHAVGLVHGALRPENVLFVTHGTVKISDFGIAWNPDAANEESAGESTIGAAWPYVAPECYTEGEAAPGSDVYSAGVILCEMLTGSRPYDATTPTELVKVFQEARPPPVEERLKGQPTPLIELLATALAIAPAGRPSPAQLAESLGKCVPLLDKDRGPESSPRLAVVRPPSQSQRRQPRPFGPRDETEAAQERAQFQKRAFTPTGPSSPLAAVFTPGRLARIGGITVASLLVAWFLTSMALSREPHYYAKSIVFILLYAVAEVGIGAYLLFMETTSETEPGTRVEIRNEMGMAVRTEYTEGSGEAGSSRMSPGSKLVIHVRDETVVTMFDASSNAVVRSELIRGPATIVLPKSGSPRG